jgi:hypothetical protein
VTFPALQLLTMQLQRLSSLPCLSYLVLLLLLVPAGGDASGRECRPDAFLWSLHTCIKFLLSEAAAARPLQDSIRSDPLLPHVSKLTVLNVDLAGSDAWRRRTCWTRSAR